MPLRHALYVYILYILSICTIYNAYKCIYITWKGLKKCHWFTSTLVLMNIDGGMEE